MEQTGSSGTINMSQMYSVIAQMQNLLNSNANAANLSSYAVLQEQVRLFTDALQLASSGSISLSEALKQVGLDGSTAIENAKTAMSAFRAEVAGATFEEIKLTTNTEHYNVALNKVNTLLATVRSNTEKWTAAKNGSSSKDYQIYSQQADALEKLSKELQTGTMSARDFNQKFSEIKATTVQSSAAIRAAGENTQTFSEKIGNLSSKFGTWFSITRVIMAAFRSVKQMVSSVIELDTAMTELKKVTDETDSTYEKFLGNASSRAKQLGAALSDTVTATADFARLGFSIEEAEKLADTAIVYKNVGDGIKDISEASESIIATMQAFGIAAEGAMTIVDKFNEVGNNYAISSEGVGEALLRSAAAMHAANNSLDETIALATAANTIVQNPEKVGTTLKTVSMYLRAAKTEAEEAGEATEGMATSVSELRKNILALTNNKVDIQIDENTFKSTYQILKELSEVWGELTDLTKANILEMVGNKHNSNVVAALLDNFSVAENALETSANSAGSALKENEKVLESIQGKINIMKASFETLSNNLISGDLVKFFVDAGTGILDFLNGIAKVIDAIGGLSRVLLIVSGIIATIKADSIFSFIGQMQSKIIKTGSSVLSFVGNLKELPLAFKIAKSEGQGLSAALELVGISASTAQIAIAALVAVLTIAIIAAQEYNQQAEELRQKQIENAKSAKEDADSVVDLYRAYQEASDAYKANTGTKENLTSATESLLKALGVEKSEIDNLKDEYGELGKAIDNVTKKSLEKDLSEMFVGLEAQKEEALRAARKKYSGGDLQQLTWGSDKTSDTLEKLLFGSWGYNNLHTIQGGGFGNFEGVKKVYDELLKYKQEMEQSVYDGLITQTELNDASIYKAVVEKLSNLKSEMEEYYKQIDAINSTATKLYYMDAVQDGNVPETKDELTALIDKIYATGKANKQFVGTQDEVKDSISRTLSAFPELSSLFDSIDSGINGINSDAPGKASESLSDLADTLSELKSAYELLATAEEEMASGGLSADTIKALADSTSDYLDYLYEENGVIKLNTEAWKEYANAKMEENIRAIEASITELENEKSALEEQNEALQNAKVYADDYAGVIEPGAYKQSEYTAAVEANTSAMNENAAAIEANQAKLGIYKTLYGEIATPLDAYSAALNNFTNIANAITSISNALTTVADLQETVANGFTISLEKALEFAKVYPEILDNATVAADGQITLNEGVVNAFISGKEAELKAQIDAKVAELEADKSVLTAKMEFSKAQLELAKSVGTGEGQISKEVAEYRVNTGNAVAQALIAAGIDEATAYQLACAAMAQNSEEFNRVAAEVCTDVQGNFNQAAYDAAQSIYKNMQNSKLSIASVAEQAHQAALAIAGIGSGKVQGSSSVNGGGAGGSSGSKGNITVSSGSFKGTSYSYESKTIAIEDFVSDLELDISNYTQAISQIDGQIAALKALRNSELDKIASNNKSNSNRSSNDSSSKETEPEIIDWIEVKINRIRENIDRLANKAKSSFKSITDRIKATNDEIKLSFDEISVQQKAYDRYMQEADKINLSSDLKSKVQNGTMDISAYDKDVADAIKDYQDFYEKAIECKDAVDELKDSISELYQDKFDAVESDFDNQLSLIEHAANEYNNELDILEEHGYFAQSKYYNSLIAAENQTISKRKDELTQLSALLEEAVSSGKIEEGSESWYDMKDAINSVSESIQEAEKNVVEFNNSIRDLEWEKFDYALDRVSKITEETDFLINLLDGDKLYEDDGRLTDNGLTQMALREQNYAVYMRQAAKYADEYKKVSEDLAKDPYNKTLIERKEELLGLQQESIEAAQDEKQAIVDMVEEGINKELESIQKLIDAYTDALDSAKSLSDYQKNVSDKTSEIASLRKQLLAYSNDGSEETRATIQRLNVELKKAEEDLKDTEYDRYISDQKELLNNLYTEYETVLNQRLDNIDALMSDVTSAIDENSETIENTILLAAAAVGYNVTDSIGQIWSNDADKDWKKSISDILSNIYNSMGGTESTLMGDVNGDGKITGTDARLALRAAARLENLSESEMARADLNGDGKITPDEARSILLASARLKDLPTSENTSEKGDYIIIDDIFSRLFGNTSFADSINGVSDIMDVSHLTKSNIPISSASNNVGDVTYQITIPIDHVLDYEDFMNQMKSDSKFADFLKSATIDRLTGANSLSKNKYIW